MYFPSVHVENFFDDPYAVLAFSDSLPFSKGPNDTFAGVRSPNLQNYAFDFFLTLCRKQLSIFYSKEELDIVTFNCETFFQRIPQSENAAFVHEDPQVQLICINYLTPGEDFSGTSVVSATSQNILFRSGEEYAVEKEALNKAAEQKQKFVENPVNSNLEGLRQASEITAHTYKEVVRFNSIFNSMIMFNPSTPHTANFNPHGTDRLTLVSIYHNIQAPRFPVPDSRRIRL